MYAILWTVKNKRHTAKTDVRQTACIIAESVSYSYMDTLVTVYFGVTLECSYLNGHTQQAG